MTVGRRLAARKLLLVLAVIISVFVAVAVHERLVGLGSKTTFRSIGSLQILVDTHKSALASLAVPVTDQDLDTRAPLYAEFGASSSAAAVIAQAAGVPLRDLLVTAQTSETTGPGSPLITASYNSAPATQSAPYEVTLTASNELPIITVSTKAPTAAVAAGLAQATLSGLRLAVQKLENPFVPQTSRPGHATRTKSTRQVARKLTPQSLDLRALGPATSGTIATKPSVTKAIEAAVGVLIVLLLLILLIDSLLRRRQATREAAVS